MNIKHKNISILNIIFFLLPASFLTGPFLPDFTLTLLTFFFLYKSYSENKINYFFKNKFVVFFLSFYFYLLFLLLINSSIFDFWSVKSVIFYFRYILYVISIYYFLVFFNNIEKSFYYGLLSVVLFLIIDSYIQYFFGSNLFGFEKLKPHRLSGLFQDELILGSFLLKIYFLFMGLSLIYIKKNFVSFYIIFTSLFTYLIFLSGERSAFYLFIIGNIISLFLINFISNKKKFFITLIIFIGISVIAILDGNIRDRMFKDFYNNQSYKNELVIFTKTHHGHYMSSYLMFRDKPLIGQGPNSFKEKCKIEKFFYYREQCATHPHNYYIQLLAETGIIGFIFLFILFFYIVFKVFKIFFNPNKGYLLDFNSFIIVSFILSLWPLTSNGNFFNNWLSILNILPLAFYLYKNKAIKEK